MKATLFFALLVLGVLFIAGCQDESAQAPVTDTTVDDAAAVAMIDAEIALSSQDGWKKQNRNFIGILSGREEVPVTNSHGRGVAKFQVAKDGMSISYKLIVANISNVVGADIHVGPAGENGPAVFGLYSAAPGGGRICGPIAHGSFTPADLVGPYAGSEDFSMFLSDLHADSLYVNVRTDDGIDSTSARRGDYPDGEIRGQLKGHRPEGRHDKDQDKHSGRHDGPDMPGGWGPGRH